MIFTLNKKSLLHALHAHLKDLQDCSILAVDIRSGVFPETLCLSSLMEHSSRTCGKGNRTIRI